MKAHTIRRWVRLAVLSGCVLMVALFLREHESYTIPDEDQSLAPDYPGGSRLHVQAIDGDESLEIGLEVVYEQEKDGTAYARFGQIAGLPGDVIESREGVLHVNGEATLLRGEAPGQVPAKMVYILVANPFEKRYPDSRELGFIAREAVRAIIKARFTD